MLGIVRDLICVPVTAIVHSRTLEDLAMERLRERESRGHRESIGACISRHRPAKMRRFVCE